MAKSPKEMGIEESERYGEKSGDRGAAFLLDKECRARKGVGYYGIT